MEKQSYKDIIRAKLADLVMEHNAEMGDECFEELCTLVNEECLRSFRNGIAAGKSRAGQPERPQRPRWQGAQVKRGALANGKLKPVEKELVVEEE